MSIIFIHRDYIVVPPVAFPYLMEDVHRPGRAAFARYRDDRVSRPKLHSHLQLRRQPKRVDSWRCFIHTFVGVDANDCGCNNCSKFHPGFHHHFQEIRCNCAGEKKSIHQSWVMQRSRT